MIYVPERDGIAACPDDPARVSPPCDETAQAVSQRKKESRLWHRQRATDLILKTLNGELAFCPGLHRGRIVPMTASDLYDKIMGQGDQNLPDRLLASAAGHEQSAPALVDAKELVALYVEKIVDLLVAEEVDE